MKGARVWTLFLLLCACLLAHSRSNSEAGRRLLLYVGNSEGDDVSVIDLASQKLIGDIKVGQDVHGIALQADGRRLFTTLESDHTLRMVDTQSGSVIATIQLIGRPNQCAVTPNGKYVVVPIRDAASVEIVDVAQQKVLKILPIQEPHNAFNAGSNRYMFVSSMGSHEINVIDLDKLEYSAVIPAGGRPRPYVVSEDGKTIYTAVSDLHGFVKLDVATKKVVERVEIPSEHHGPPRPRKYETPDTPTHGLALSPDENELWVTSLLDDCVYVYDLRTKKVVGRVNTGDGPNWVAFSPDGKYVCVSATDSDDVSIIDARARREIARVRVGKVPKRLAVALSPAA